MPVIINSRAKLPANLATLCKQYKISARDLLSTNPKTEKSKVQTYILHLAPADTSGVNVCAGAGNCRKICLHFAGNPVYMTNKQAARIRRTLAYANHREDFMLLLVCAILHKLAKHPDEVIAVRPNGTSDNAYENVDFTVTPEFTTFCRRKFGVDLPIGKRNIFEVFNHIASNGGPKVQFYDYTKIRRNWAECARLGYHLTFSFDGWNNKANLAICRDALQAGVNVAAAFNLKRGQSLPDCIDASRFNLPQRCLFTGGVLAVLDGDLTDFRPSDATGGHIVGLRFKLPHGINYSDADKQAFCIA
jgi:hypothetical protein